VTTDGPNHKPEDQKPPRFSPAPGTPERPGTAAPSPASRWTPASTVRPPGPIPATCAQCGAEIKRTPASVPFRGGPHQGGFLCQECWILEWDSNPDIAADAATRQWVSQEARKVRLKRAATGGDVIYQNGENRAYRTQRGTIVIDLKRIPFGGADEFDRPRLEELKKLLEHITHLPPAGGE
jgi:hypothetical protein